MCNAPSVGALMGSSPSAAGWLVAVGGDPGPSPWVEQARAESPVEVPPDLVRASRAWLALKVSPAVESLAFLARGIERGRPARDGACAVHVLGPLLGAFVGPAAGPLPRTASEEFFMTATHRRKVTASEWTVWIQSRHSPYLLEDVTTLAHSGTCAGRRAGVRCTCRPGRPGDGAHRAHLRVEAADLGWVPVLVPDPTGRTDPWHEALVELASRFRGPGTYPESKFSGEGAPSVGEVRDLLRHLEQLAARFAGPTRVNRMQGLGRVAWDPALPGSQRWQLRERAAGSERVRDELFDRLRAAVRV